MANDLRPADDIAALQAEIVRLNKIVNALMNRAERETGARRSGFGLFRDAVVLENQVRRRTAELRSALQENERINRALTQERAEQQALIHKLEEAHNQLLQSEKMASIGQLAAGVAHEINNPIGYVNSNLGTLRTYLDQLLGVLDAYAEIEPACDPAQRERLAVVKRAADLEYLREDILALLRESGEGVQRVKQIVQDLKDFSHVDEAEWQVADLHQGLDSTLNVVHNEIKYRADVIREYGDIPRIECLPSQLNQVFMNMLVNAAHAMDEARRGKIVVRTGRTGGEVWVEFADDGKGIAPENLKRIFDPFFTTKPVGKGTGLGLSLSYGIVEKHHGRIEVQSTPGQGTTFRISLPVAQTPPVSPDGGA